MITLWLNKCLTHKQTNCLTLWLTTDWLTNQDHWAELFRKINTSAAFPLKLMNNYFLVKAAQEDELSLLVTAYSHILKCTISKQSAITYSVLPYTQCVAYCRRLFFLYSWNVRRTIIPSVSNYRAWILNLRQININVVSVRICGRS
jgi:hypothetical protein